MSDDRELGSDVEEMGPGDVPEPGPDEPGLVDEGGPAETPSSKSEPTEEETRKAEAAEAHHSFRQAAAETVAKAVGMAVELGSVLGGQGGEIVSAERDVAEAETEDLIDGEDEG